MRSDDDDDFDEVYYSHSMMLFITAYVPLIRRNRRNVGVFIGVFMKGIRTEARQLSMSIYDHR